MFTTGQKVVCIDDVFPQWVHQIYTALPKQGCTYTVRAVSMGRTQWTANNDPEKADFLVRLVELKNPTDPKSLDALELGFRAERFRPLLELKTETANIVHLYAPAQAPEPVAA